MIAELMGGEGRIFLSRYEVPVEKKRESRKTRHKVVNASIVHFIVPAAPETRAGLGLERQSRSFLRLISE